jgi:CHAT domain-containing protein
MKSTHSLYTLFFLLLYLSSVPAQTLLEAKGAFQRGDYKQALSQWQKVLDKTPYLTERLEARLGLAQIYRDLGHYHHSHHQLKTALALVEQSDHPLLHARLLNEFSKQSLSEGKKGFKAARQFGQNALDMARRLNNPLILAEVLNHWGNVFIIEYDYEGAVNHFDEALSLLRAYQSAPRDALDSNTLAELETWSGKLLINRAQAIFLQEAELSKFTAKKSTFRASIAALNLAWLATNKKWVSPYQHVFGLISLSQLTQKIQQQLTASSTQLTNLTTQTLFKARDLAILLDNATAKAYSYGYLGQWYEQHRRYRDALQLTRQALFFAGQTQEHLLLSYLWQWQTARIFKADGDHQQAIKAYQQAIAHFQQVRTKLITTGYVNLMEFDFREKVAPIYFELADLLLQQAHSETHSAFKKSQLLQQARATIESFKAAELQDYLQADCLDLYRQCLDVGSLLDQQTALLYTILLPNRLELLLQRHDGLKQFIIPIDEKTLREQVISLSSQLHHHPNPEVLARKRSQSGVANAEICTPALRGGQSQTLKTAAHDFLKPAQTLYQRLIKPLQLDDIKTLVIVPDGILRTIPFAALHDGEHFLIEKYALATLPNLCLKPSRHSQKKQKTILLSGLSKAIQGFSGLPCAKYELESIQNIYNDTAKPLLNESFTYPNLQTHLKQTNYDIVHIASHAQFSPYLEKTFVLTYDDKLNLDKLSRLISNTQLKTKSPLELLTLSACETGIGNDRAPLGLAGVALKAGTQSVFASLWAIDDEATPAVVIEFYKQLQTPGLSKAKALQNAQKMMLTHKNYVRYRHPYYWAAFLLIGHWF